MCPQPIYPVVRQNSVLPFAKILSACDFNKIQRCVPQANCIEGSSNTFVNRDGAQIEMRSERRKMFPLMTNSKSSHDFVKGTRFSFRFTFFMEEDAQFAGCRSPVRH